MERFVNPLIDIVFKTMWIRADKDLKDYFNRILTYALKREIKDYHIGSNETGILNIDGTATKVDILLENGDEKIDIELNNLGNNINATSISKTLNKSIVYLSYYVTTFYDKDKTDRYKKEIKVEQINLNNFRCLDNMNIERLDYKFVDTNYKISQHGIESHHIYLPRMKDLCYTTNEDVYKDYAMLVCNSYEEMEELAGKDLGRRAFISMLKELGRDEKLMDSIRRYEDELILKQQEIEDSKAEGFEQGIEQGKNIKEKELVISMHESGISIEKIQEITELTEEEIKSIIEGEN